MAVSSSAFTLLERFSSNGVDVKLLVSAVAFIFIILTVIDKLVAARVDPREPPVVKGILPIIGHWIAVNTSYPGIYEKLARTDFPICTIPILGKKMYVINSARLVQSAMRNQTLDFGARIEEIGRAMGIDPKLTHRLIKENAIDEVSHITASALSGGDLLKLNLGALDYLSSRFNGVKPGAPEKIDHLYLWTQSLIGVATTRALYGEHSPFNDLELVDAIWTYESGMGKMQYGLISLLIAYKAIQARMKMVRKLTDFYVRKLDQGPTVSAAIRTRTDYWRNFGISDDLIASMDAFPSAATVNTAPSMFWLLAHIFTNPTYLARVRQEVEASSALTVTDEAGKRVAIIDITELVQSCPYVVGCYRETLRAENTVTGSRTVTSKDTTITDHETGRQYLLKEGVEVQWSASVMHKKPIWGEDREVFDPERWLKNSSANSKGTKESYIPFGGGKHLCPGRNFALAELLGVLSCLAVGFELDGVQMPDHEMPFSTSAVRSPVYGSKSTKASLSRRVGWEDVEWRFK